jgi:hypothetical protein
MTQTTIYSKTNRWKAVLTEVNDGTQVQFFKRKNNSVYTRLNHWEKDADPTEAPACGWELDSEEVLCFPFHRVCDSVQKILDERKI